MVIIKKCKYKEKNVETRLEIHNYQNFHFSYCISQQDFNINY